MMPRTTRRLPIPPAPARRQPPTGWRALLIGIAFGFSAGFLFTIGLISLINANTTSQAQPPIANNAASASASATPAPAPTLTPTPAPTPTFTPTPIPAPTPTPVASGTVFLAPNDPTFYIGAIIIFLILSGFLLLRVGGKK